MNLINKNHLFLLEQVIRMDFAAKYKDSVLGILWSILQPLLIMILLTIIFSTLFGFRIDNYPVFYLSGWAIFTFFTSSISVTMLAIKRNRNILNKINSPKHIFVLGGVASEFINFLITLVILLFVMIATKAPIYTSTIFLSVIPIISLIIMIIGLGLLLSILCAYYSDVQHIWRVITMLLMYASALFYPIDIVPEPYKHYMLLNPLYWIIDQFRKLATYGMFPSKLNILNSFLLSMIILIIGIIVFKKYEKVVTIQF